MAQVPLLFGEAINVSRVFTGSLVGVYRALRSFYECAQRLVENLIPTTWGDGSP